MREKDQLFLCFGSVVASGLSEMEKLKKQSEEGSNHNPDPQPKRATKTQKRMYIGPHIRMRIKTQKGRGAYE